MVREVLDNLVADLGGRLVSLNLRPPHYVELVILSDTKILISAQSERQFLDEINARLRLSGPVMLSQAQDAGKARRAVRGEGVICQECGGLDEDHEPQCANAS